MTVFPDTSFLCALYRRQSNSAAAVTAMQALSGALPVTSLLLLEFRQSARLQVRLHAQDRTKGFAAAQAAGMLRHLHADLTAGVLEIVPVDWAAVHRLAEELSARHTTANGHRLVDILHVATALQLGAVEFFTFDENQRRLAKGEGLKVP